MRQSNSFTNARLEPAGSVRGGDDDRHDIFKIERPGHPPLYGDYIYVFPDQGDDFNVEIGVFGYLDMYAVGDLDPRYRQRLSPGEASTVEQLIRSYFLSDPPIYAKRFLMPPSRFLGGVSFRPNWLLLEQSEHESVHSFLRRWLGWACPELRMGRIDRPEA